MAYARPAPDRPRGAAVKAYWLEPRNRRRGDREPGPGLTPYSVEQADPDPRPWRDVGIKRGAAISAMAAICAQRTAGPGRVEVWRGDVRLPSQHATDVDAMSRPDRRQPDRKKRRVLHDIMQHAAAHEQR